MPDTGLLAIVALIATILAFWMFFKTAYTSNSEPRLPRDRGDQPYTVFTTQFDIACDGSDLIRLLEKSGNDISPTTQVGTPDLPSRRQDFERAYRLATDILAIETIPRFDGTDILLLLDQSGSMAPRMPRIAGQLLAIIECLEEAGANVMLAGFTTLGWHGGKSREAWSKAGRPEYPGRLCDIIHVTYSPFDRIISSADMHPLLETNVLFENIDGEALQWACNQFPDRSADGRLPNSQLLVVVSDGAPVDDSTILANGKGMLWQHLMSVISDIETQDSVALGALGINHAVDKLYRLSAMAREDEEIVRPLFDLLTALRADNQAESTE